MFSSVPRRIVRSYVQSRHEIVGGGVPIIQKIREIASYATTSLATSLTPSSTESESLNNMQHKRTLPVELDCTFPPDASFNCTFPSDVSLCCTLLSDTSLYCTFTSDASLLCTFPPDTDPSDNIYIRSNGSSETFTHCTGRLFRHKTEMVEDVDVVGGGQERQMNRAIHTAKKHCSDRAQWMSLM